jgi:hypothetical protein
MIDFQIVKVNGKKFGSDSMWAEPKGWAAYVPGKGFLAFTHDNDSRPVKVPYQPKGGRKALQAIKEAGGFLSLDGMEFIQPCK